MMAPLTKYTRQISSSHNIPARVREALRRAEDERPGAVHLELPEDIAREQTSVPVIPRSRFENPRSSDASIAAAAAMIERARHPLLLIGAGANRRHTCRELAAFIDQTGIPFFSTQMGKGVVDERHPLFPGAGLPDFVKEEFDAFLECGILAHGFLRLRCTDCGHEKLVAF